jgi:hypothetical protein
MFYIGIDYSIKSPAIAICDSTNSEITFLSFPRDKEINRDCEVSLTEAGVHITKLNPTPISPKKTSIAETERQSMFDAIYQTSEILTAVRKVIGDNFANSYIGIEGFSFASTSSRLAQISGYQWLLRYQLLEAGLNLDNFYVFAPTTVKATAGKGNYKKEDMITAFLNAKNEDLEKNIFFQTISKYPEEFQNRKGSFLKPIDDIIDSYWILQTLYKNTNI